jgi:hypothetical protein
MTTHQGTAHWTGHALNGSAVSQAAASAAQNTGETPEQLEERCKAWGLYFASQLQAGQTLTPEQHQIAARYLQSQGTQLQAASQQAAAPSASGYQHGAGAMGYNNYSAYYQPHASYNYSSGCAQQTGQVIGGAGGQGLHYQQQHLQHQQYQMQQYQQQQREHQQKWQKPRPAQQQQAPQQQPREPDLPQHRGSGADGGFSAGGCHPPAPTPSLPQPAHKGVGVVSAPVSVQASIVAAAAQAAAKIRACQESASAGAACASSLVPRSAQASQTFTPAVDKLKYGLTPIRTTGLHSTTAVPGSCSSLPSPAAPSPARPEPGQWPAAMRDWIERSFAQCDSDAERKTVEATMKKRIAAVDMWAHNWEREPLPSRKKEARKEMWYPGCPDDLAERERPPRAPRERVARSYGEAFGSGEPAGGGNKKGKRHKAGKGWDKGWDSAPPRDAGKGGDDGYMVTGDERGRRERRASRFESSGLSLSERADRWNSASSQMAGVPALAEPGGGDIELDFTVQGTSTVVEKKYLRLTSAPDPRSVRPEPVLRQALDRIRERIVEFGDLHGQEQYMYLWEQMKSVRQDLTVQRIRNKLTVEVRNGGAEMMPRLALWSSWPPHHPYI